VQFPFTTHEFFEVFARYNLALWPAALGLWIVTVVIVLRFWNGRVSPSTMSRLLAFHWAWSGIAYHAAFFTEINPAAWLFAILFLLQAGLFIRARALPDMPPSTRFTVRQAIGSSLIVYALAYPALNWMQGHAFPRIPMFGVPCPTTILTAGVLLSHYRIVPWWLAAIPVGWSIVGGSGAWLFTVHADWVLPVAGLSLLMHAAHEPHRIRQWGT
jgi:hypothetical protein